MPQSIVPEEGKSSAPVRNRDMPSRGNRWLALRLKTRWRDGTTRILMERSELIERLVPLIPPPLADATAIPEEQASPEDDWFHDQSPTFDEP